MTHEPKATADFETRSACDLRDCGSWRYSLDPTTEVMVLRYRLPYWEEGRVDIWNMAFPSCGIEETDLPIELFNWIAAGGLVEAHNAWFERGIWQNVCVARMGWPAMPHRQWRCSAAKAAALSLPRKLDDLCVVLRTKAKKDKLGHKIMMQLSKPRKPLKKERLAMEAEGIDPDSILLWREDRAKILHLFDYCRDDVLAEEACSALMPELHPRELEVWLMDQAINERGFQIDQEAVETALSLVDDVFRDLNAELITLTGGLVEKATQRQKMRDWINEQGIPITDTQGATVETWLLRKDLPPKGRRALELMLALGKSSTAKYEAFRDWVNWDWRICGGVIYHGASTGRWTGSGPQPHNFPRGNIKDMELAWRVLKTMDVPLIEALYEDLMTALSHGLRGAIVAAPGRRLYVADYAAIEARVVMWLAGETEALDVFRRGDCIYCEMGTEIYKREIRKGIDFIERQMGKQAILGLGFQMGWKKFRDTCAKYGIFVTDEFAQEVVKIYRRKYRRVAAMWDRQNNAAIEAVKTGRTIKEGLISWRVIGRFLHCKLPSGRLISYCDPLIIKKPMPWDPDDVRDALSFMAIDSYTKKWVRQDTYGGSLVENIVQGTARDLMAEAMLRAEQTGVYDIVLSVHDELIAEADEDKGSVKEFEAIMAHTPDWAAGCPVSAEGWTGFRYKK